MVHITVLQELQRLEQEVQEFKLAPGYTETLFNKERGRGGRRERRGREGGGWKKMDRGKIGRQERREGENKGGKERR